MRQSDQLQTLLNYHFQHHRGFYSPTVIENSTELLAIGAIKENDAKNFELNFDSDALNEEAMAIAATMLSKPLPKDILGVFKYIKKFDKALKAKFGVHDYQSVYRDFLNGMRTYSLALLNQDVSTHKFLVDLLDSSNERAKELKDFEEIYFRFLKVSGYSVETIYNSCVVVFNKHKDNIHPVYRYLFDVGKKDRALALEIYDYGIKNDILKYPVFASNIIIGLNDSGYEKVFTMTTELILKDGIEGMKAACGISFNTSSEIEEVFSLIENIVVDTVLMANQKSLLLCRIIENDKTPKDTGEKCVHQILDLLKSENHDIANEVFHKIQYNLDNHEYEKYIMLHTYLNSTNNFPVLNDFFYSFKDSQYLFDLMIRNHEAHGFRATIERLEQTILHFWNEDPIKIEARILNLFRHPHLSLLAVKIMLSGHGYPLPVDINKLDEGSQKSALESMCKYPHSIDKLVPTILKFRFSAYQSIQKHLQTLLQRLIFDTYHESLYKLIEDELDTSKEKKFLTPLKKALTDYENMKKFKSIKDLDPMENERNLMDLYYRLEHENQAKIMNDGKDRGGLSSMFKSTIIVRGKAWKLDEKEEIVPLQLIQSSMMVDSKAYKNPIAYEQNLENS